MLRVEREQPRVEFRKAGAAVRAGALGGEHAAAASRAGRASRTCTTPRPCSKARSQARRAVAASRAALTVSVATGSSMLCSTKRSSRGHFAVGQQAAVDAQLREALAARPLGERGIQALARDDQRRQQGDALAAIVLEQARGDGIGGLRLDARFADRAVLHSQLHVQQAQKVIDLGERRHRALVSAAAGALLDGDGGRDAEDGVDVGTRGGLHELPRVGVQGLEIAALSFGEQNIECQGALAAARDAGNDGELIETQVHVDVLEIVFAGAVNLDGSGGAVRGRAERRDRAGVPALAHGRTAAAARHRAARGRCARRRCA